MRPDQAGDEHILWPSQADRCWGADGTSYAKKFSGKYSHRILEGIGHNVPQEAPQAFTEAVVEVDGY